MKITIEPDDGDDFKKEVYENVFEFAIVGTSMTEKIIPQNIIRSHGNKYILIGKMAELKERLRNVVDQRR